MATDIFRNRNNARAGHGMCWSCWLWLPSMLLLALVTMILTLAFSLGSAQAQTILAQDQGPFGNLGSSGPIDQQPAPAQGFGGKRFGGQGGAGGGNPERRAAMMQKLQQMDTNGDGQFSREELPPKLQENFDLIDQNSDSLVSMQELGAAFAAMRGQKPGAGAGGFGQRGGFGQPGTTAPQTPQVQPQSAPLIENPAMPAPAPAIQPYTPGPAPHSSLELPDKPQIAAAPPRPISQPKTGSQQLAGFFDRKIKPTAANLAFGNDRRQALDLYAPADAASDGKLPVVVMVHGGAWMIGDKATRDITRNKVPFFNAHGWIFVSVNYRLVPDVTYREQAADVAAGLIWLRDHVAEYGGDPERIFGMGHSAGAHLIALVATDHDYLQDAGADASLLKGVVLLDGAGYNLPQRMANDPNAMMAGIYDRAFGTDPADLADASPQLHVKAGKALPPFMVTYVDRPEAPEASKALTEAIRASGNRAELLQAPAGYKHETINAELGAAGDPVGPAVMAFLGPLAGT